jgi:hypothetical protein
MDMLLVRLKPYDPRRGHVLRRFTYRGIKFHDERGWYRVDKEIAEYLRGVRQVQGDKHSPLAFDVCTEAEARALDERAALTARVAELEASEVRLTEEIQKLRGLLGYIRECEGGEALLHEAHALEWVRQDDLREEVEEARAEVERLRSRLATVEGALRDLLLSADCTWEERRLGHDWAEACEAARAALSPATAAEEQKPVRPSPVCSNCNDTHWVSVEDGPDQMCTRCPTPCQRCRAGGTGSYCATTPCDCECHQKHAPAAEGERDA